MRTLNGLFVFALVACSAAPDHHDSSSGGAASGGTSGFGGTTFSGGTGTGGTNTGGASSGGSRNTGGTVGGTGGAPNGGATSVVCTTPVGPGLPTGAPTLEAGVWKLIDPQWFDASSQFAMSLDIDPCNPATLYLGVGSGDNSKAGYFRSTDAGSTWVHIAAIDVPWSTVDHIDGVDHAAVDPADSQHLYAVNGVTGSIQGFFVSTDGGDTFEVPPKFLDIDDSLGITSSSGLNDVYYLATDPTDFNHLLLSFHSPWTWASGFGIYSTNAGVVESTDGGNTFITHDPLAGWGEGHIINFLYAPELGVGDAKTWLLGTQGDGMWRTTNAGESWVKVTDTNIVHGGGAVRYATDGTLYATGADHNIRSTDNGATWTSIGPGGGYFDLANDGTTLYVSRGTGGPFVTSPQSDGVTWNDFNSQTFQAGAYEMAFDSTNGILYAACRQAGLWALKVK